MKKIIVLLIASIVAVGIASYFYFSKTGGTSSPGAIPEVIENIKEKLGGGSITSGWQTYTSSKHGFSIKHPSNYIVRDENEGIVFVPPELESISKPPETLKELPLIIVIPKDKSYADLPKELKRESEGASYYEEAATTVMDIQGVEVKIGPKSSVGDNLHKLFRIIPYKNKMLIFITMTLDRKQLEGQGTTLLDAFISTFKPESS